MKNKEDSTTTSGTAAYNSRLFNLDRLLKDDVVIEQVHNQRQSPFFPEYQQAREIISAIIKKNLDSREKVDSSSCISYQSNCDVPTRINNIVSFIGERGTGKSSAMLSVRKYLCSYTQLEHSDRLPHDAGHPSPSFAVLQFIDASALKSHEDIVEIILSRMFKYAREIEQKQNSSCSSVYSDRTHTLYQHFSATYKALLNLRSGNTSGDEESALLRLQEMTSSYSLAEKFQNLVMEFLKFLRHSSAKHSSTNPFLVISIDDIDLYQPTDGHHTGGKNSYTLLEDIYELFMIPGVIVLATFNDSILQKNCLNHLLRKFEPEPRLIDRALSGQITGKTVASAPSTFDCLIEPNYSFLLDQQMNEFLKKVLPAEERIYMPKLIVKDYPDGYRVKIRLAENPSDQPVLSDYACTNSQKISSFFLKDKEEPLTPKRLMLNFIAAAYGCFFDGKGNKLHFFEQRNLRQLKDQLLTLIPRTVSAGSDDNDADDARFVQLFSFVLNQFSSEHLSEERELSLFRSWMQLPVERRSRDILAYIRAERNEPEEVFRGWKYSYGELLQSLYSSTRADSRNKQIFTKDMVCCILASYSIVLPHLYQRTLQGYKDASHSIHCVLGSSITGRWSNEILDTMFYLPTHGESTGTSVQIGSVSYYGEARNHTGDVTGGRDGDYLLSDVLRWDLTEFDLDPTLLVSGAPETNGAFCRFLRLVEVTCMLFTNVRSHEREHADGTQADYQFAVIQKSPDKARKQAFVSTYTVNLGTPPSGEATRANMGTPLSGESTQSDTKHYFLQSNAKFACFNILNFAVNSFAWKAFFAQLHASLLDALVEWCRESNPAWSDDQQKNVSDQLKALIEDNSLKGEYGSWSELYGCCAIPFQHFDMTYNILKRLKNSIDLPGFAKTDSFFDHCAKVYCDIRKALVEQDEFYHHVRKSDVTFEDTYLSCPFVEIILHPAKVGNSSITEADLKAHFKKMADHLTHYVWYSSPRSELPDALSLLML